MCLSVSTIPLGFIIGIQGFNASILFLFLIFVVTFYFSLLISQLIISPIKTLTVNLDKISKGQLDVKLEKSEIEELNNLINSLNRIMASLKLAIYKFNVKKGEIFEDFSKINETVDIKQDDILNTIPGWIWEINCNGVITFCSKNVFDYLGYYPNEIIGKNFFDLMNSEDAKKSKTTFNAVCKNKESIKNLENWLIKKNGDRIYVKTNAFAIYDESGKINCFKGFNVDVTSEKLAQEKIKDLNKELFELKNKMNESSNQGKKSSLIENFSFNKEKPDKKWDEQEFDSVFTFDINANILDCNENMYKTFGYSKDEMLSLNVIDLDVLETKKGISEKINATKKNSTCSFKTIYKKKDGSTILVSENLQYLKNKNTFKCIVREDYRT